MAKETAKVQTCEYREFENGHTQDLLNSDCYNSYFSYNLFIYWTQPWLKCLIYGGLENRIEKSFIDFKTFVMSLTEFRQNGDLPYAPPLDFDVP